MADYTNHNAKAVLEQVRNHMADLETAKAEHRMDCTKMKYRGYSWDCVYKIDAVFEELSIFDWWNETLSMSQLKQMEKFLVQAIKLGFTGYVCFKVGAAGCSHGMWAYKVESTTGYSPDGDTLFHSFRSGDNYWDAELDGVWMHEKYATEENRCPDFTLAQIKAELA